MSEWTNLIDNVPVVMPVDDRNDWHSSAEIRIKDTLGHEAFAIYYVRRDNEVEEWWDCADLDIVRSMIRYWKPSI